MDRTFDVQFEALTGFAPMGWQRRLFARFIANEPPNVCDIPTGLGKTSVIVIWILALAQQAARGRVFLPRRLIYVVNRRTVVDQATDEALRLRAGLSSAAAELAVQQVREALADLCVDPNDEASPLAISTLRGELADNREWQADPARASIIVGTVDMIGSRLLFSGYGVGWKMRAFHAGLLGQDSLLVHDEAHLTPAFSELLRTIAAVQRASEEPRPLRVLELSATQRREGTGDTFALESDEWREDLVKRRVHARKSLRLHSASAGNDPETAVIEKIVDLTLERCDTPVRVLVYVRSPDVADEISRRLQAALGAGRVALLTGRIRGFERDQLATINPVFAALRADVRRPALANAVVLVSTSAGEVGVNLDADHVVCDLTTLDSMVQRLGRVNRLGRDDENFVAWVDVIAEGETAHGEGRGSDNTLEDGDERTRADVYAGDHKEEDEDQPLRALDVAVARTRDRLAALPRIHGDGVDGSPWALRQLLADPTARSAFAPAPRIVTCTDVLLDAWTLTSLRGKFPGRPPVHNWLHGAESTLPETIVVWRAEVSLLAGLIRTGRGDEVDEWLSIHRIEAREQLRVPSIHTVEQVQKIARRCLKKTGAYPTVLLIDANAQVEAVSLEELSLDSLVRSTLLLPPDLGGLDSGFLSGEHADIASDVADAGRVESPRLRVAIERTDGGAWRAVGIGTSDGPVQQQLASLEIDPAWSVRRVVDAILAAANGGSSGGTLVERLRLVLDEDDDGPLRLLLSLGSARAIDTALGSSTAATNVQTLREHLDWAGGAAERLGRRLFSNESSLGQAIEIAARWHDQGKNRASWQRAIGHPRPRNGNTPWEPWAKNGSGFDFAACAGYRHELGSLLEAMADAGLAGHPERELVLHLISAHHGRARPHFPDDAWDPNATDVANRSAALDAARRFDRLQAQFGRWGLAWLEAVLKAADVIATVRGSDVEKLPR